MINTHASVAQQAFECRPCPFQHLHLVADATHLVTICRLLQFLPQLDHYECALSQTCEAAMQRANPISPTTPTTQRLTRVFLAVCERGVTTVKKTLSTLTRQFAPTVLSLHSSASLFCLNCQGGGLGSIGVHTLWQSEQVRE